MGEGAPWIVTMPSSEPGVGWLPESVAVTVCACPGLSEKLLLSRLTWAAELGIRELTARVRFTAEDPVFVILSFWLSGRLPELRIPNESVAGSMVMVLVTAAPPATMGVEKLVPSATV